VEGVAHDIRYEPLEFDGWSQRHWTLPFVGERYSLVWFTPLGVRQEDLWWNKEEFDSQYTRLSDDDIQMIVVKDT
jgi:2-polyprenyl-6-methoxyphenol hydroxylase-like FAD-dependent oxidoreductase